jgi:hypothetical protein
LGARRYYRGVYRGFREHGGLPPLFRSSLQVLRYYHRGMQRWNARGVALGLAPDLMRKLTDRHGAHWGMVRWSRRLNTIEMRCFDTDRVDLDLAKLALVAGAMRRLDASGEALTVAPRDDLPLAKAFTIEQGAVVIPSHAALKRLVDAAIERGLRDDHVTIYLARLAEFAARGVWREELFLLEPAVDSIARRLTTSDRILAHNRGEPRIDRETALETMQRLHAEEVEALTALRPKLASAQRARW